MRRVSIDGSDEHKESMVSTIAASITIIFNSREAVSLSKTKQLYRISVDSMTLHYSVWGNGPALVLLHGGSGSWTHWIRNVEFLAQRYTVIVPDLPGNGDSDLPRLPFDRHDLVGSMNTIADDVWITLKALLIDVLKAKEYKLVGFSMGSILSGALAARYPQHLRQLVLVGTSALGMKTGGPVSNVESLDKDDSLDEALLRQGRNLTRIMLADPDSVDELARKTQYDNVTRARIRTHWLAASDVLARSLPAIQTPTEIIWGTRDIYAPDLDERERVVNKLKPGVKVHRINGAGHWVMYERADEFNDTLGRILSRTD